MTIRVALNHYTRYRYKRPVHLSPHGVRLRPALPHTRLRPPIDHFARDACYQLAADPFGNYLARRVFAEETTEFSVAVGPVADLAAIKPFDFFLDD